MRRLHLINLLENNTKLTANILNSICSHQSYIGGWEVNSNWTVKEIMAVVCLSLTRPIN